MRYLPNVVVWSVGEVVILGADIRLKFVVVVVVGEVRVVVVRIGLESIVEPLRLVVPVRVVELLSVVVLRVGLVRSELLSEVVYDDSMTLGSSVV